MNPLSGLADTLTFQTTAIQKIAGNLADHEWLHRAGESSHAYWLLGHVAYCRHAMLRLAGVNDPPAEWEKLFGKGSKPETTFHGPPVADLVADVAQTGPRLGEAMKHLTEAELQKDAPRKYPNGASVWAALSFMSFHEAYHVGQMALLCRVQGKPGLA